MAIIPRDFFIRPTPQVARDLLGCQLVRQINGHQLVGQICETEAYQGESDLGCHAHVGKTKRNQVMYAEPGHAYLYFVYGMHWLLNIVTEPVGVPAAVLIRAIHPLAGRAQMAQNRPQAANQPDWLNGPAKLTRALALDGAQNGLDLCSENNILMIASGKSIPDARVKTAPRVGLNAVPEPWKSIPWRFMTDLSEAS